MVRLSLLISVLLIGLSIVIAKDNWKSRNVHQKLFSQNNEPIRTLRNLVGKLIDTDTNTVYTVDGQKEQDTLLNPDATTTTTTATKTVTPPMLLHVPPYLEETACIAACNYCVEDYSLENRKKRAINNCGPLCDCADSCLLMSAEEVDQIYGQNSNTLNDKQCWWRTYTEILNNGLPSLA